MPQADAGPSASGEEYTIQREGLSPEWAETKQHLHRRFARLRATPKARPKATPSFKTSKTIRRHSRDERPILVRTLRCLALDGVAQSGRTQEVRRAAQALCWSLD